jgi:hypothetical protein
VDIAPQELKIVPVVTSEMTVIQQRLIIQEKLPELWYKDEGGRDKCMTLPIFLVNEKNERVGDRPVPLRVTLLYENEHPVLKQDILKMSPDCQRTIDSSGKALLKLRIEDVSKNHQGQAFRLKVEPDTAQSPMNFDVAFDLSSTISVRSKRNKRRQTKSGGLHQISHHVLTAGISNSASATSSPSSNTDNEMNRSMGNFNNSTGSFVGDDRLHKKQKLSSTSGGLDTPTSSSSNGGTVGNNNTLTGAMEKVLSWTGAVVHGLHQLEWQTVGYESKTDGTPDPERPIYRCPACWRYKDVMTFETAQHDTKCLIANLLLTYATDTMGHLDYVLKSIEQFPSMLTMKYPTSKATTAHTMVGMTGHHHGHPHHHQMQLGAGSSDDGNAAMMATSAAMMMATSNVPTPTSHSMMSTVSSPSGVTGAPSLGRGITDMINSIDGPPGLFRGTTVSLTEFMRSLSGEDQDNNNNTSGNGTLGNDPTSFYAAGTTRSNTQPGQVTDAIELQVFYVLARMITLDSTNSIGFPAFDMSMNLLGFYQEGRDNAATTEVVFVPVSDIGAITQVEISQTQRLLRNEIKENSAAVHTLARCNNDLVKLKEDVILFHWNAKDRNNGGNNTSTTTTSSSNGW